MKSLEGNRERLGMLEGLPLFLNEGERVWDGLGRCLGRVGR